MAESVKTLSVYINLKSKAFTTGLRRMEMRLKKFGRSMSNIGSRMTSSITLPIALVGGAAIKLASDFSASMTKIQTLVGLPADEVDKLKQSVLDLAGKTAQAPQELAEGLYFLTSAGLDSESALRALEQVSKGVASGLGESTDLAKAAAAAQNAYGEEVLSAGDALDIFGTMVRTGMFEASELAEVLGTQLGLASNLGISMEELGGLIATYTRTTGDAKMATTGLSGVMMAFAKITPKQEQALKKIGLTANDVRKHLGEQGLQKTLLMLSKRFEDNNMPLSDFFSKSQALKGVMGVLGEQTESYTGILEDMHKAQGFVNDAFAVASQESTFKFQKALADLKVAGVELGNAIIPIATKIASKISQLAKAFSSMSEETQKKIIKVVAALALLGPSLFILGKIALVGGGLIGIFRKLAVAVTGVVNAAFLMNPYIVIPLGLMALLIVNVVKEWDKMKFVLVDVINWVIKLYNENMLIRGVVEGVAFAFRFLRDKAILNIKNIVAGVNALGKILLNLFNKEERKKAIDDFFSAFGENAKEFSDKVEKNVETMRDNLTARDPIELITVEDVDNAVAKGQELGEKFVDKVKDTISNLSGQFSDLLFAPQATGGGGGGDEGGEESDLSGTFMDFEETFIGPLNQALSTASESIFEWSEATKTSFAETFEEMKERLQNFGLAFAEGFADMVATTIVEGGNLAKAFGNFLLMMLKDLATMIIKMLVFKAIMTAIGLPTGGGGGVMKMLFGMQHGGLAFGPTPVMVGEGRGTSMSNPEVIAPLDKLRGMIGGGGTGRLHGEISGSNILLSNDRSTNTQDRVSGSVTDF